MRFPGDEVIVRVSVLDKTPRYRAELVRLICGETGPKGPGPKEEAIATTLAGEHDGREQPTNIGSYIVVESPPELSSVDLAVHRLADIAGARRPEPAGAGAGQTHS